MKRILSLILAMAICMGFCAPALAADTPGFADVKAGSYYYDAVQWAVENDIVSGLTPTEFGVNAAVNRAQVVTFLWRLAGSPAPKKDQGFSDVPKGRFYADAVNWAAENGVVYGYSARQFAPDEPCSRQQAATFLYRYEQFQGGGFRGFWSCVLDYEDQKQIAGYAYEALCWMTMNGVLHGYDGKLDPRGTCSRAQFVTMLYHYAETASGKGAALKDERARKKTPAYTEKTAPVLRERVNSTETVKLRYYTDLPNVPYMKLTDFYNQFYLAGTRRTVGMTERKMGNCSVYTNFSGYSMTADAEHDILCTEDLQDFILMAYYLEMDLTGDVEDFYPFLDDGTFESEPEEPVPMKLDLGAYGIDLRAGEDGLYFPLGTLCDLFADASLYYVVWNGEKLYVADDMYFFQDDNAIEVDRHFSDVMAAGRKKDLADFAYRELCFNIDAFYGRPGQEYIHDDLERGSLDGILSEQYPEIKARLLSTDPSEYLGGIDQLFLGLLCDGGHTMPYSTMEEDIPVSDDAIDELANSPYSGNLFRIYDSYDLYDELYLQRTKVYKGDYYIEQGDTAMIRLDGFDVDYEGWQAFYVGEGARPLEGDILGTLYAGLERASKNPEIKNVILDITCNGGGDSGGMNAIEWLMTGEGYLLYQNRIAGMVSRESYQLDANLDGQFDEKDQPYTQFRYGVLTSAYSFSCANLFPFFMKDHGAMILGEQSSGGACCVRINSTADGVVIYSSYAGYIMCTEDLKSVDNGCPVDADLTQPGRKPYAKFYDLSVLSDAMNAYFDSALAA